MDYGLGRRPAPDSRDHQYLLRAAMPRRPERALPSHYEYQTGPVLDQGQTSQCVGYSWRGFLMAAPIMTTGGPDAATIYHGAQQNDEWPGEDYEGSSVRGGAKYLQGLGNLSAYLWAFTVADVERWMLSGYGPLVIGSNWYERMFDPDASGRLRIGGRIAGGHAYLLYGCNRSKKQVWIQNSWGPSWGVNGRAYLTYRDLERLLREDGEACTATEQMV